MGGRMRLSIVGVAGFTVVALVVVAVQLLSGGRQGARAKPVPRGPRSSRRSAARARR